MKNWNQYREDQHGPSEKEYDTRKILRKAAIQMVQGFEPATSKSQIVDTQHLKKLWSYLSNIIAERHTELQVVNYLNVSACPIGRRHVCLSATSVIMHEIENSAIATCSFFYAACSTSEKLVIICSDLCPGTNNMVTIHEETLSVQRGTSSQLN